MYCIIPLNLNYNSDNFVFSQVVTYPIEKFYLMIENSALISQYYVFDTEG